ncbi:hypothetical protein [Candidatus Magnetominusculus xianensis]|uniref:Uncharacterized protein n=1 Tax=Candidatus Magnetominusculus xianensis TaxID=1748249 RepID=A0ABR5SGA8_9BACT|nr:hypothetical protein [Candidatus Magnetominusculus xianensis]KWT85555.1 hypothetical protein ASN18_1689 [Candidatus Magnetominusculus xianensis]MBF0404214.1 hypothetical protein [Nitrospirota bacterium]
MFCWMAIEKIEHDIEEIGLPRPGYSRYLEYFPIYRLKVDIDYINDYLGISITDLIIRENIINPFKRELLEHLEGIHKLINKLGHNRFTYNLHMLVNSLDVKIYEYYHPFRNGAFGYRSSSSTLAYGLKERRLPAFMK